MDNGVVLWLIPQAIKGMIGACLVVHKTYIPKKALLLVERSVIQATGVPAWLHGLPHYIHKAIQNANITRVLIRMLALRIILHNAYINHVQACAYRYLSKS